MRIPDDILPDAWRSHSSQLSVTTSSEQEEVDEEDDDHLSDSPKTVETSTTWNASDSNDLQRLVTKGKERVNSYDQGAAWHNDL
jgi:hypothetical protein